MAERQESKHWADVQRALEGMDTRDRVSLSEFLANLGRRGLYDMETPEYWGERTLCAETDLDIFYSKEGGDRAVAKRICAVCEVRPECLEHAIATGDEHGVRGGMTETKRKQLIKEARRNGA